MNPPGALSVNQLVEPQKDAALSSSRLGGSLSPSGLKIKKNFNLGKKIDEWWTAVRSSFTPKDADDKQAPSSDTSSNYRSNVNSQSKGRRERRRLSVTVVLLGLIIMTRSEVLLNQVALLLDSDRSFRLLICLRIKRHSDSVKFNRASTPRN